MSPHVTEEEDGCTVSESDNVAMYLSWTPVWY